MSFKLFPFWYNKTMKPFSQEIKDFIKNENWVFAKTYAKTWPHEYIIRDKVHDKDIFLKMAKHIREFGRVERFYEIKLTYFEEDGLVYWTMVPPVGDAEWYPPEKEEGINRCPKESTYEERLKRGEVLG
ncbi:MAG: hypothetical protein OEZ13_04385 [Spirochaetia bacterium]|nr:hypothetical protein [Spirochaetia bacterium]